MNHRDAERMVRKLGMSYALQPLLEGGECGRLEAVLDDILEEARGHGHRIRERNHLLWNKHDKRNELFYATYAQAQLRGPEKSGKIIDSFKQYYGIRTESANMREIAQRRGCALHTVQMEIHFAQLWLKHNRTSDIYYRMLG